MNRFFEQNYQIAINEAIKAQKLDEVPVGAAIFSNDGNLIASCHNLCETEKNPCLHAEILAISQASSTLNQKFLSNCSIFVTLEPCHMCAAAISFARIKNLHFAIFDEKMGGSNFFQTKECHHKPDLYPAPEHSKTAKISKKILKDFFKNKRAK